MKITKNKLKQIIKEEIMNVMREGYWSNEPAGRGEYSPDYSSDLTVAVENAVEAILEDAEGPLTLADIIVESWGGGGGEYDEEQPEGWAGAVEEHLDFMEENGKVNVEVIGREMERYYSLTEEPVLNLRGKKPDPEELIKRRKRRESPRSPGDFRTDRGDI